MGNSHPNMIDPDGGFGWPPGGGYSASNPFLGTAGVGGGGTSGLQILGTTAGILGVAALGNAFAFQNAVGELNSSVKKGVTKNKVSYSYRGDEDAWMLGRGGVISYADARATNGEKAEVLFDFAANTVLSVFGGEVLSFLKNSLLVKSVTTAPVKGGQAFSSLGAAANGFSKATIFIKGVGNVSRQLFHQVIKPKILKASGNFTKAVGRNPDVFVENGKIFLKGVGEGFKGKTFPTGLNSFDFFP